MAGTAVAELGQILFSAAVMCSAAAAIGEAVAMLRSAKLRPRLLQEMRRALPWSAALVAAQLVAMGIAVLMRPDFKILGFMAGMYLVFALLFPVLWSVGQIWAGDRQMPRAPGWSPRRKRNTALGLAVAGLALNLFTVLITEVKAGAMIAEMADGVPESALAILAVWLIINAPWHEELIIRHYLLPHLAGRRDQTLAGRGIGTAVAIGITAVVFALGHAGHMEPAWPKLMQTFIWGLALGWARVWLGTWYAIGLHLSWNLSAPLVAPFIGE